MSRDYRDERPELSFSQQIDALGPFQIGTREATWGADPLETLGGFRSLEHDDKAQYDSSLGLDGAVSWSRHAVHQKRDDADAALALDSLATLAAKVTIDFPDIDWKYLQSVYGWPALQWQAWVRGSLILKGQECRKILLNLENILEFWLDGEHHFGGDYYEDARAPHVFKLEPGHHRMDIRLIREVRSMGAVGSCDISFRVLASVVEKNLVFLPQSSVFPDFVNSKPAGSYCSIALLNTTEHCCCVQDIEVLDSDGSLCNLNESRFLELQKSPVSIAAGQCRALVVSVNFSATNSGHISLRIISDSLESLQCRPIVWRFSHRHLRAPHQMTFLHPSGIVSRAIIRTPSLKACRNHPERPMLPVFLHLHGAGLNITDKTVEDMMSPLPDLPAWVLFPSGVTAWSGDDWHTWGFADVEAGIQALEKAVHLTDWDGPGVDTEKWLVTGHSNGGQGTWYALTHRPDKIIAAAPVSGYSSIQAYVPYQMWNEADPRITLSIDNALRTFRHELLIPNFESIPVSQQHGDADDNVPVFHSRRLHQLIGQCHEERRDTYNEIRGKGHWYDGIMTTPGLTRFYENVLNKPSIPCLPKCFTIVVADAADLGSRGGIQVDALFTPGQLGRIFVEREGDSSRWTLTTSNISKFHFESRSAIEGMPSEVVIDTQSFEMVAHGGQPDSYYKMDEHGSWITLEGPDRCHELESAQPGSLNAILRSKGSFNIRSLSPACTRIAMQIARNLFQYFAADSELTHGTQFGSKKEGNVVTVGLGRSVAELRGEESPIRVTETGLQLDRFDGSRRSFDFEEGLGVISLNRFSPTVLEVLVWGFDLVGLRQAARLFPMLTGVGQPDFVILRRRCAWEGAAGVFALGSFTSSWKVSESSFIV